MNLLLPPIPFLELAILSALVGGLWVSFLREPLRVWRWGLIFTQLACGFACMACLAYYLRMGAGAVPTFSLHERLTGLRLLAVDEMNAPLLLTVALLHFLTALATGRTKMRRYSLAWSLISEAGRLTLLGCPIPELVIGLLVAGPLPGYIELRNRGRSTRVFGFHMILFAVLVTAGWTLTERSGGQSTIAALSLLGAILIRCGTIPFHCWITDWFEHASFGNALLFVVPLTGVYAAVRLVLPIAPDWLLRALGVISLVTAIYAAGMSTVQVDARRFFAYLAISLASLILVGLELHTAISLTGALVLWVSVSLALGGFGLTIRALEARFGPLAMTRFHGLYDQAPALAMCFLVCGLACIGFPGTLGFIAIEMLVDGTIRESPAVGLGVVAATALNGIAVVRAYFRLFTGVRHISAISLAIGARERAAVLTLVTLIFAGGLFPQIGVSSRNRAAMAILQQRAVQQQQFQERPSADTAIARFAWRTAITRPLLPPPRSPRGLWRSIPSDR